MKLGSLRLRIAESNYLTSEHMDCPGVMRPHGGGNATGSMPGRAIVDAMPLLKGPGQPAAHKLEDGSKIATGARRRQLPGIVTGWPQESKVKFARLKCQLIQPSSR